MISRKTLEAELKSLEQPDDNMQPLITHDVLTIYDAITKVADESGHSGFSFNYMMGLVNTLIIKGSLIRPIRDIDEDPDDWADVSEHFHYDRGEMYQNKRRPSVFCEVDAGGCKEYTDNDICAVTDDDGEVWYHSGLYKQFERIKVPYTPDGMIWRIYAEPSTDSEDNPHRVIKKIEKR